MGALRKGRARILFVVLLVALASGSEAGNHDDEDGPGNGKGNGGENGGGKSTDSGGGSDPGGGSSSSDSGGGSSGGSDGGSSSDAGGGSSSSDSGGGSSGDSGGGSTSDSGGGSSGDSSGDGSSSDGGGASSESSGGTSSSDSGGASTTDAGGADDAGGSTTDSASTGSADGEPSSGPDDGPSGGGSSDGGSSEDGSSDGGSSADDAVATSTGSGGGGGGGGSSPSPTLERAGFTDVQLRDGAGTFVADLDVLVNVTFRVVGDFTFVWVRATPLATTAIDGLQGVEVVDAFDVEVRTPDDALANVTDAVLVVRSTLPNPVLLHGGPDGWTALATTPAGDGTFRAAAGHVSPFALAADLESAILASRSPPDGAYVASADNVELRAFDNLGIRRVSFTVDGDGLSSSAVGGAYRAPAPQEDGVHAVHARIEDHAGGITHVFWNYTLDRTAPEVALDLDGDRLVLRWSDALTPAERMTPSVAFTGAGLDAANVAWSPDGEGRGTFAIPEVASRVGGTFTATVVDAAGNAARATFTYAPVEAAVEATGVRAPSASSDGDGSSLLLAAVAVGAVVAVAGWNKYGPAIKKVVHKPRIKGGAAARPSDAPARCDLCLGGFKLDAESHRCACGVVLHSSCYVRAGTCPGCGSSEGIEVVDA